MTRAHFGTPCPEWADSVYAAPPQSIEAKNAGLTSSVIGQRPGVDVSDLAQTKSKRMRSDSEIMERKTTRDDVMKKVTNIFENGRS
ncbi:hypothetical protein J6590_096425 [Homalodisca vitripennis]|nr:hypothetical protein J6590_096425 [Homalodisca vitripennis]